MLLAFTVNSFIYFSFGNIYSSKILNYADFSKQFHSGIYQYRILSGYLIFWIYETLSTLNIDYSIFKFRFLESRSEPQMYLSFYILNTIFLVLSAALLLFITETKNFIATNSEKILLISVAVFAMAITQFVIVPYDVSSYFLIVLFFYFLLKYLEKNSDFNLIILVVILMISTLNRETSALSISLAATLLYSKYGFRKELIKPVLIFALTFIAVYFGMRFLHESFTTNDGNLLFQNFSEPKNILGFLFWMVFFLFTIIIAKDQHAKRNIILFHVFSIPYVLMCIYTGIMYEIRLYIPIFITSLLISRTDISKIH
jgi:hypothetical protein